MKKTEQMINDFLQMVEEDKVLAARKLAEMEEQRHTLDKERSEISKALIREENKGDQDAVQKLNKELAKRVNEISVLDSKIEAYKEMGSNYEAEVEKIFVSAAKELNEDYPKEEKKYNEEIIAARKEVEEAKKVLITKEKVLEDKQFLLSSTKSTLKTFLDFSLPQIMSYMPNKIKDLMVPEVESHYETIVEDGISKQKYVQDSENYGYGLEGKLNYYFKEVLNASENKAGTISRSIVDKILGR